MQKITLKPSMRLTELALPFLEVTLEEVFLLGSSAAGIPYEVPRDIEGLALASGLSLSDTTRRLREIMRLSTDLYGGPKEQPCLWLQVDYEPPYREDCILIGDVDFEEFFHGSIRLGRHIVCFSRSANRAYSAVMFLRMNGLRAASIGRS